MSLETSSLTRSLWKKFKIHTITPGVNERSHPFLFLGDLVVFSFILVFWDLWHRLDGLNNKNLFSCSAGSRKATSKMLLGLVSGEDCFLSWRGHLLSVVHVVLLFVCREKAPWYLPSSYKNANPDTLGALHIGLDLSSLMDPSLHKSHYG